MRIRDLSNSKIRIGHAFRSRLEYQPEGNVLVIQPKNIKLDGTISFGSNEPLRMTASAVKPLKQDELLVVNRGRFAAAVFDQPGPEVYIVPSSILIVSVETGVVSPQYLAAYINSTAGQKMFRAHSERSTVPYISPANLGSMDIPVPPLERQQMLVELDRTAAQHTRLSQRKETLLRQIIDSNIAAGSNANTRE